jgi:hypothetical protein
MARIPLILAGLMILVAAYGAFTSEAAIMVLGLVLAVGAMAANAISYSVRNRADDSDQDLSPTSRTMLRPIRVLKQELEDLVAGTKSETVRVLGLEALEDARHLYGQAVSMLRNRDTLTKNLFNHSTTEAEVSRLEKSLKTAQGDDATALSTTLEARRTEIEHYHRMQEQVGRIDADLKVAEATLSELKTRLTLSDGTADRAEERSSELKDSMQRLRALSVSFDEADDLLREAR